MNTQFAQFFLVATAVAVLADGHASMPVSAQTHKARQSSPRAVDFFDIIELPIKIEGASVRASGSGSVLEGSVVNRSTESIIGCHFILLVVDPTGKVRQRYGWSERMIVEGVTIQELGVPLPKKIRVGRGERIVLGIEQVVSKESIWRAMRVEEAMQAYGGGRVVEMPEVRRAENLVGVPS